MLHSKYPYLEKRAVTDIMFETQRAVGPLQGLRFFIFRDMKSHPSYKYRN